MNCSPASVTQALQPRVLGLRILLAALLLAAATGSVSAAEPTRIHDVVYGRKSGMALTMDVLKPEKPSGIGVIFMLSGGFHSDISMAGPAGFTGEVFQPFLKRGQTVFLVCHGSQPKFFVPEILSDIHRAVRFIRTHAADYGVDPNRLGITGASSGGYLSIAMGTGLARPAEPPSPDAVDKASSEVQAVACFFPPTDLVDYGEPGRFFNQFEPVKFVWHTIPVTGKSREEQQEILKGLSPLSAVTEKSAPTFIITGDNDALVPHEQSERFIAALKEKKVVTRLDMRPGAGHGWPEIAKDFGLFAEWFDEQLVKKE